MTTQVDALLTLVESHEEMSVDDRAGLEGLLWSNPIVATPELIEQAKAEGSELEAKHLDAMIERGLIVAAAEPEAKRAELAGQRPGYHNRAMRRAAKKK